jgi:hypothetical protein
VVQASAGQLMLVQHGASGCRGTPGGARGPDPA